MNAKAQRRITQLQIDTLALALLARNAASLERIPEACPQRAQIDRVVRSRDDAVTIRVVFQIRNDLLHKRYAHGRTRRLHERARRANHGDWCAVGRGKVLCRAADGFAYRLVFTHMTP